MVGSLPFVAVSLLACVVLPIAIGVAVGRLRAPTLPDAEESRPGMHAAVPAFDDVAVLLPVRNEEKNVAECLAALRKQTVPIAIFVLEDGSTDATHALASGVAAVDERVRLLEVPEPEEGVSGKVNALRFGMEEVRAHLAALPEWLLLVDADARPSTDALARTIAAARGANLATVSLAARQEAGRPGDALLTPLVFGLLDAVLWDWTAAARGLGEPVANGQFILVRADALEASGGFQAIEGEMLDDVALVRLLRNNGFRTGFMRAREVLAVRMYHGLGAAFDGWSRNLALFIGDRRGTVLGAAFIAVAPFVTACILATLAMVGGIPLTLVLGAWMVGTLASVIIRSGLGTSPLYGLLYPIDGVIFAACLLTAYRDRRLGRMREWRGRSIGVGTP